MFHLFSQIIKSHYVCKCTDPTKNFYSLCSYIS